MLKKSLNKYSLMVLAGSMVVGLSSEGCGGSDSTNDDSVLNKKVEKLEKEIEDIKAEKDKIEKEKTTIADDNKKKDAELAKIKADPNPTKPDVTKPVDKITTVQDVDIELNKVQKESSEADKEDKKLKKSYDTALASKNLNEEDKNTLSGVVNGEENSDFMKKHGDLVVKLKGIKKKQDELKKRKKSLEERKESLEKRKDEIKKDEIDYTKNIGTYLKKYSEAGEKTEVFVNEFLKDFKISDKLHAVYSMNQRSEVKDSAKKAFKKILESLPKDTQEEQNRNKFLENKFAKLIENNNF